MNNARKCLGFIGCLAAVLAFLSSARAEDLNVAVGNTTRLQVGEPVRKIFVANPSVIKAGPAAGDETVVLITGLSQGNSLLTLEVEKGSKTYNVTVRNDVAGVVGEIKDLLGEIQNLQIKQVGGKVLLDGAILAKSDFERIKSVAAAYSGLVLDLTKLNRSEINDALKDAIKREINLPDVAVKIIDETAILEGVVYSEQEKARAEERSKSYVATVKNFLRVQEVIIETDVQFIQVDTSKGSDIGFNVLNATGINANVGATGAGTGTPKLSWGAGASVGAKVQALLLNGDGKQLVEKYVVAKSGSEGMDQVGGTLIIPIPGNVGGSVEKIPYGVIIKVKPTLQGRETIVSDISLEVSVPNGSQNGGFVIEKSETKTTVSCKIGESVVLSGLKQQFQSKSKSKTPFLGDFPLVSLFFSESKSANTKKEVVMVMTPRVLLPGASTARQFSDDGKKLIEQNQGK